MSDKVSKKPVMDFETLSKIRDYQDVTGRVWRVRVHGLGSIDKFHNVFGDCMGPDIHLRASFYATSLTHLSPGLWILFRRMIGMPDFSIRFVIKYLPFVNIETKDLLDIICRANLNKTFDEIISLSEAAQKKSLKIVKTGPE